MLRTIALLLAFVARAPLAIGADDPEPPSILVLVLDDAGFEDMGPETMPVLSAAMPYGRLFTRMYTAPSCSPSRSMLNTGCYPHRDLIGATVLPLDPFFGGLSTRTLTAAEVLNGNGYATGMFGKWHLSSIAGGALEEFPRVHGFETWRAGAPGNLAPIGEDHYGWTRTDDGVQTFETTYSTRAIADALRAWWTATPGPKFGTCCFLAPHAPFDSALPSGMLPPRTPEPQSARGRYESALRAIDQVLLELAEYVDLANTYLLVLPDNGTPLNVLPPAASEAGYKSTPYEGGCNVPLLVFGPGVEPGVDDQSLVSLVDLPLTFIELAGVPAPARGFQDAISLVPALDGTVQHARTHAWSHIFWPGGDNPGGLIVDDWCMVRDDGVKLVGYANGLELFDLTVDPHEQAPLDLGLGPNAASLAELLAERAAILGPNWPL